MAALTLSILSFAYGQNLVPNGSFEEYTTCPDNGNQLDYAVGWASYRGSPDYFNPCDATSIVTVPLSFAGNLNAANGESYAGIIAWHMGEPFNQREYMGAMLGAPLIPEVPVYLSFKVNMAMGGTQQDCRWSVDGVGLRFSMEQYMENNNFPSPNDAAINLMSAPSDTVEWILVSGVYVPDSAYQYVVIGNFFDDDYVTPVLFNSDGNINRAYAFVDDVCVSYDPDFCPAVTGITNQWIERIRVFPNPFTSELCIKTDATNDATMAVWMQDVLGRRVWSGYVGPGESSTCIDGAPLSEGSYVIFYGDPSVKLSTALVVRVSP